MNNQGWMAIHRKIKDTWIWTEKPFSKGQAWIDLLLMANWEEKKVLVNGNLEVVGRGEKITSIRQLCEAWGWSNRKVKNFLNLLQSDNMIAYKSTTKYTTYKIVNYNTYQDIGISESTTKAFQKHNKSISKAFQKHTNNNINNINNNNNNKQYIVEQSPTVDVEEKKTKKDNPPYEEIIDYLNVKAGKNFKATTKTHQSKINGRWREGYRLDDFKQVIDNKVKQWGNDPNMDKYLRPDTLFSTKFESYLNEKDIKPQVDNTKGNNYQNYDDDYEDKEMEWARKKFEKDVKELMKGAKQ